MNEKTANGTGMNDVPWPSRLRIGPLQLRVAQTGDEPFLRQLYADVRRAELAPAGWPEAALAAFCDSQFTLQTLHHRQTHPDAVTYLLVHQGQPVGRMCWSRLPEAWCLVDVSLLSACRRQGWGSALLAHFLAMADAASRPVCLHVMPDNPARRLYARHGFEVRDASAFPLTMWRAPCTPA